MSIKIYRFPLDGKKFTSKRSLYDHIESNYPNLLSNEMTAARLYFNLKYKKSSGRCVISGKPTKWNENLERYERFYSDKEATIYKEEFRKRMLSKYGKTHLLDSDEQQKKMLNNRKITIEYKWLDNKTTKVNSQYEYEFLKYLEDTYQFTSSELVEPPTFYYEYSGKVKMYLPDFYIPSLDLIIEVKGSNDHYQKDLEKLEDLKKEAVKKENMQFIQINDRNYIEFDHFMKVNVIDN